MLLTYKQLKCSNSLHISFCSNDLSNPIYDGTTPYFDPSPGDNPTYDSSTKPNDPPKPPLFDPSPGDNPTYDLVTPSTQPVDPPKHPLSDPSPGDNPTYDGITPSSQPVKPPNPPLFDPSPGNNPAYDSVTPSAHVQPVNPSLFDPSPGGNPTYGSITPSFSKLPIPPKQPFDVPPRTNPDSVPSLPILTEQSDSTLPPVSEYDPESNYITPRPGQGTPVQENDNHTAELAESPVSSDDEENGSEKQSSVNIYADEV